MCRYVNRPLYVRYDTFGLSTIAQEFRGAGGGSGGCENGDGDYQHALFIEILYVLDPSEYSLYLHFTTFIHTHIHWCSYVMCMLFVAIALVYTTNGSVGVASSQE